MHTSDFRYDLPEALIAQYPLDRRTASRLLVLRADGSFEDSMFARFGDLLRAGDLLVLNDTRVIPARVFGTKDSGGAVEVLIERLISETVALAHVRASKAPKPGRWLTLDGGVEVQIERRVEELCELRLDEATWASVLREHGHMPLPPYIDRVDAALDQDRYQTVYARRDGAVAAPTAGLHFDRPMLDALVAKGVELAQVTLHVGVGTFQPVRCERIEDHRMHAEYVEVSADVCEQVRRCQARGGRVVAVGTTAVRSLETAAAGGVLAPYAGDTRLFITPGFPFHVVDAFLTNFHLPESTLLMLVSAFGGHAAVMRAYRHAVEQRYRFFSYGDAMFLERSSAV